MKIINATDYKDMSRKAANLLSAQIILKPNCVLGLCSGQSPIGTYEQLVEWYKKGDLDFSQVRAVSLDEYCGLAETDPQSYRRFMEENLYYHVNIKRENTFLPNGMATDAEEECRRYDEQIAALGGIDIQLLGLGYNGHIGFNEPDIAFEKTTHCVTLTDGTRRANAQYFPSLDDVPPRAITMGIKSIMQAKRIVLLVNNKNKSYILRQALFGPVTPRVPASILQLHPNLTVVQFAEHL